MNPNISTSATPTEGVSLLPERQPYQPPAITYEAPLEVRAGSPPSLPNLLDETGN